ncbi:MAG: hypothetical protein ACI9FN_001459 [Saprospiraceae bacterium]|jgi:hypothetical protein
MIVCPEIKVIEKEILVFILRIIIYIDNRYIFAL